VVDRRFRIVLAALDPERDETEIVEVLEQRPVDLLFEPEDSAPARGRAP
jgi:hypothetical protein